MPDDPQLVNCLETVTRGFSSQLSSQFTVLKIREREGGKNVKRSEAIFNQRIESKIFDEWP